MNRFVVLILIATHASITSSKNIGLFALSKIRPPSTTSEICPHGVHYLNSCKNLCSCSPVYGGKMCHKMGDIENCTDSNEPTTTNQDFCPFGSTYSIVHAEMGEQCICYCNNNKSRTYECFQ